ncbi:uncharacterized protein LOC119078783 [Bradysia coprophila]|uniref:uncharacterized protein LOC119078783 n=1 Tax=Bradysia coprophila TaxID=38358 RepID=UPI00187DB74F|nr:uncharacterized protein LOC119078783 [Bradysia coprophila]
MVFMTTSVSQNVSYARAIVKLDEYLLVEERAKRYMPEIGFYSTNNVHESLRRQIDFTEEGFMEIVRSLQRPHYFVSSEYLGSFFGKLFRYGVNKYTSFFVVTKLNGSEKATDKCLNLHICVYTVRDVNGQRDSIYYDPAPPCHSRAVPNFIRELRNPEMRSATVIW